MITHSFEISVVSSSTTVNVESLAANTPAPRSTFQDYTQSVPTASGGARGLGWPVAVWEWDFLTQTQFTAIKALCPGASVACWIRTLTDDYATYKYYSAILRWPQLPVQQRSLKRQQIRLEFVNLVEYTPSP
jgi:hypothetical protein